MKKQDKKKTTKSKKNKEISLEKYPMLDLIHDRARRLFRLTISSKLRKVIDVEVESTEINKFKQFKEHADAASLFWLFKINPFDENAVLYFPPDTAFTFVDFLFGGTGKQKVEGAGQDFTAIEVQLLKQVALWFLNDLQQAWKPIHNVQLNLNRAETNPEFIHSIPKSEEVVAVKYKIDFGSKINLITLVIPFALLQHVKEELKDEKVLTKKGKPGKESINIDAEARTDAIKVIQSVETAILADAISNEHPQTIALVLSVLDDAEKASETLLRLPDEIKSDVVYRVAKMNSVSDSALETLDVLAHEIDLVSKEVYKKFGGIEFCANMLKSTGKKEIKSILSTIKKNDTKFAEELNEVISST